jgi:hypothetical protein
VNPAARNRWSSGADSRSRIEEEAATCAGAAPSGHPRSRRPREKKQRREKERKECMESSRERKTNLTLKTGFVYHVMNNTCIHLRAKGPNIYMYKRGRIYKEPPGEIQ